MRKLLIFISILSLSMYSFAQKSEYVDINSKITGVTVFLRGAQVERTGSKAINVGVNKLRLSYLSPNIDPNSIKVTGVGAVTILSVSHGIDYLREGRTHAKVKLMEDSIQKLENKMQLNLAFFKALEEEWSMIVANKKVNNSTGFDIEDVDDLALYYRSQLRKIAIEKQSLSQENTTLKKVQTKLKKQMNVLSSKWNKATSEIIVEVSSKVRTTARLNVSYVVRNAGWIPNYDIRVKESNSPMTLNYKAKIYQNSGVDWNNVQLQLSTGNPIKNATKPTMYPWQLRFQKKYAKRGARGYTESKYKAAAASTIVENDEDMVADAEYEAIETAASYTQMKESQVNTTFTVSIPYSILSDGKYHDVSIQTYELPAQYRYFTAPKLDKEAFLLAKVIGWDKLNLLPGEANIFFEGTYTGKSTINPNTTNDTLTLSLGRDPAIVVQREKLNEYSKSQIIGANKTETVGVKITLRNTKSIPIIVDLVDQLPLSTDKEIEIEIVEISGAKHNVTTGYLDWRVKLESNETKSFTIKYTVKYPKDKTLNL